MNVMSDLHDGRDNWTFTEQDSETGLNAFTIFVMLFIVVMILTCTRLFFGTVGRPSSCVKRGWMIYLSFSNSSRDANVRTSIFVGLLKQTKNMRVKKHIMVPCKSVC
jgi:hypothetical protein